MASKITEILSAVKTVITSLSLPDNLGSSDQIFIKEKLAMEESDLADLPQIQIVSAGESNDGFVDFENGISAEDPVLIYVVYKTNRQGKYFDNWHDATRIIRLRFEHPYLAGVSEVWHTDVEQGDDPDKDWLDLGYAISTTMVTFHVMETATEVSP